MGHVVMTSELAGVAEHQVLCIEETTDPKRAAIFAFARKVSREPASVTRADVAALRPYLKDAQIVELVFAVCRYNTINRLADAFGVPLEKENVFAPPPKPKEKKRKAAEAPKPKEAAPALPLAPPTVVSGAWGSLVVIAAGSDEGVRVGDHFDLSRGAKYVGRIRITTVDRSVAAGMFDVENPGSGAPPQAGDKALPEGSD
jgi:hypothetical protein